MRNAIRMGGLLVLMAVVGAVTASTTTTTLGGNRLFGCDGNPGTPGCTTNDTWSPPDPSLLVCSYDAEESKGHANCTSGISADRRGIAVSCVARPYVCELGNNADCGSSANFILHSVALGRSPDITASCQPVDTDMAKPRPQD